MTVSGSKISLAAVAATALVTLWAAAPTSARAESWVTCAHEGGHCNAAYGTLIHYGAHGVYVNRRSGPDGLPCTNHFFGDPLPGEEKWCFVIR